MLLSKACTGSDDRNVTTTIYNIPCVTTEKHPLEINIRLRGGCRHGL